MMMAIPSSAAPLTSVATAIHSGVRALRGGEIGTFFRILTQPREPVVVARAISRRYFIEVRWIGRRNDRRRSGIASRLGFDEFLLSEVSEAGLPEEVIAGGFFTGGGGWVTDRVDVPRGRSRLLYKCHSGAQIHCSFFLKARVLKALWWILDKKTPTT